MTTLAFFGEPRMPRLSKLLQEIQQGEILLPRFQRPLVWTDGQRLDLLESVYSGYPIGAIMVWRTQKHRLRTYPQLGRITLPTDVPEERTRQYLLDGHQRMATLFTALGPGLSKREGKPPPPEEAREQEPNWPIYFDLEDSDQPFRLPDKRREAPPSWLPLDILFDPYALRDFEEGLRKKSYDKSLVNRVQSVAEIFRDYVIPVMPIATEDLRQATVSFKRINSGGSAMSEVHMVNALVYGPEFDLLGKLEELSAELKPAGWENFDQQMILNICKARLNLSLYREEPETIAAEFAKRDDVLTDARDDILRAARVLKKIAGVRGPGSLPYSYQAVLLADALHGVNNPSVKLLKALRRWFWATTLTEYFRGMTGSTFERARGHLRDVVNGKSDPFPPDMQRIVDAIGRFDFRAARSRAVGLLLAELKPLDPAGGHDNDAFEVLAEHGTDAMSKLFRRTDLPKASDRTADGAENRFLILPKNADNLKLLRDGPSAGVGADVFASHGIDEKALEALQRRQWGKFLKLRHATIQGLEKNRAEECGLKYRPLG